MRVKIFLFAFFFAYSFCGYSQNNSGAQKIDTLLDNAFKIICYREKKISKTGSGFILFKNKKYYCITNEHVLESSDSAAVVFQNGDRARIDYIIATNHKLDACVFSIDLLNSSRTGLVNPKGLNQIFNSITKIGDEVITISSPKGLINTYTKGVVSAARKVGDKNLIQTSAPVSHGSSGGLLADAKNNPIGLIVSGYDEGQNLNFCLTLKQIFSVFLDQKIMDNNLIFNESNKVSVDSLETLIKKTDIEIKSIYDLKNENKITEYNKAILEHDNNFLTFEMLTDRNDLLVMNFDFNSSLNLILFMYKKYGKDVNVEIYRFLSYLNYSGTSNAERLSIRLLTEAEVEYSDDDFINYFISIAKGFKYYLNNDKSNSLRYLKKGYDIGESSINNRENFFNYDGIGFLQLQLKHIVLLSLSGSYIENNDFENGMKFSNKYLVSELKKIENYTDEINKIEKKDIEKAILFYIQSSNEARKLNECREFCKTNKIILKNLKLDKEIDDLVNYILK
jgi:hypothetical protein